MNIIKKIIAYILLFYVVGFVIFEILWMFMLNKIFFLKKTICLSAQPASCSIFGPLATNLAPILIISWILSFAICVCLLMPKKIIAVVTSLVIISSSLLSWIFTPFILNFTQAFYGIEQKSILVSLYLKVVDLPTFLTGLVCHNDPYCGAFTLSLPFFSLLLTFLFLVLPFFAFLLLPNKKIGAALGLIAHSVAVGFLLLPMIIYGNLYSESNPKPKMAYCLENNYSDKVDNARKEDSLDDCILDSVYWTIYNSGDNFDSKNVIKYCSNLSDSPLSAGIQAINSIRDDRDFKKGEGINFDGFKVLTKKDFCFSVYAYETWPSGEFSLNRNNQLSLCDNVPIQNNRRDYCSFYAIFKKTSDFTAKQEMCRKITDTYLRSECLTSYGAQGNLNSSQVNINKQDLITTKTNLSKLGIKGSVQELSEKIVLTKNVLAQDSSAFYFAGFVKKEKDVLLNVSYKFIDIGGGDQFGIWINDEMQFVSTGSTIGNTPQEASIDISKLAPGGHSLFFALHSYKNSALPAEIEISDVTISSTE
jgi:hypothetical protein